MLERLLEDWLDNATERSYQAPFTQMLVAQGHKIIHSTRHAPIEHGKDVVSIGPEGSIHCYQLKGNPGSRLTSRGFRAIEPQLNELTDYALAIPGFEGQPHKSYLVTNGEIEEEAWLGIRQFNQGKVNAGYPNRKLEVISRGDLLEWSQSLGANLWPSELQSVRQLLTFHVDEAAGPFDWETFADLLAGSLGLGVAREDWGSAQLTRQVSSSALLTGLALQRHIEAHNHVAIIEGWTQFAVAAIGATVRYDRSYRRNASKSVALSLSAIRDSLIDLVIEVIESESYLEGNALVDAVFRRGRMTMLSGLLSVLWLWCEEDGWPTGLSKDDLEAALEDLRTGLELWGEGAVPQFLCSYWSFRRIQAGIEPDGLLVAVLQALTTTDEEFRPRPLPSPYWSFEEVTRARLAPVLGDLQNPLRREGKSAASFFAHGLMHLLVRTGNRQPTKALWPDYTRHSHASFRPEYEWQHCLPLAYEGGYEVRQPQLRSSWSDVADEAADIAATGVPEALREMPILLALWTIFHPARATPDVVRFLGHYFNPVWMIGEPKG